MKTLKLAVARRMMDSVSITQGICTLRGTALEQRVRKRRERSHEHHNKCRWINKHLSHSTHLGPVRVNINAQQAHSLVVWCWHTFRWGRCCVSQECESCWKQIPGIVREPISHENHTQRHHRPGTQGLVWKCFKRAIALYPKLMWERINYIEKIYWILIWLVFSKSR